MEDLTKQVKALQNPYHEDIFPLTTDKYCELVADPDERTAISGLLMRLGYEVCRQDVLKLVSPETKNPSDFKFKFSKEFIEKLNKALPAL